MSELDQYDYELPRHLIAQHPAPVRVDARLLVVDRRGSRWRITTFAIYPTSCGRGIALC